MCVFTAAAAHKRVQSACKVFVALSEAFLKGFSFPRMRIMISPPNNIICIKEVDNYRINDWWGGWRACCRCRASSLSVVLKVSCSTSLSIRRLSTSIHRKSALTIKIWLSIFDFKFGICRDKYALGQNLKSNQNTFYWRHWCTPQ